MRVTVTSRNDEKKEIEKIITEGSKAMGSLNRILKSKEVKRQKPDFTGEFITLL